MGMDMLGWQDHVTWGSFCLLLVIHTVAWLLQRSKVGEGRVGEAGPCFRVLAP